MATELAKAYVQIIPSASGIKGGIENALGSEAGAAGKNLGGQMMGTLKGVIGAAAIGKALAATISEGAALQQSIGGIETLFKDSAAKVNQYANDAYRTAGLSANDYMETVTSFSASLLQGLGGDTSKAADVSNMAITDMADNANKMGTSMELIQNAYQGFAKQNYTMLDNLKLGYGGTKTEMQRLLSDAQKVSGVKYDIGNLSDVYAAIHVIQGELAITGTTAQESAATLTGSFASMKSAFQNVLGNLTLGTDIAPSLSALATTVTTFLVGNLLPAVWNILSALPGAVITFIESAIPQLISALMTFLPQFQTGIITSLPQILQSGEQILTQLVTGITNTLPQLIVSALTSASTFMQYIISMLPQILETGKRVLLQIVSGIQQSFPQIILAAANAVASLLSGIVAHLPEILSTGFEMIVSLITGVGNAYPDIIAAAGKAAKMLWDTITKIDWLQLGKNIITGLIQGIGAMAGALWDAATNIAKSAFDAICSFFGIASPSKLMRDEVGKFIPAGIAVGISGNTKPISRAMRSLADLTTGTLQTDLSVQLSKSSMRQPYALAPAFAGGNTTHLTQTIYTHDSLSESELTREAENLLDRARWKIK
ncbi:MAG: hypothetical protein RR759_08705 [Ruthenibacterium sp.]